MSEPSFGGHPVETTFFEDETVVTCKGISGTVTQLDHWLHNHKKNGLDKFYFGVGDKISEIEIEPVSNMVKIACLKEDYFSFKMKLNKYIFQVNKIRANGI